MARGKGHPDLSPASRIHMIGIGGAGMEPLAYLLLQAGHHVQGSDLADGEAVASLRRRGVRVFTGRHDAARLADSDLVVFSAAVAATNPELAAARRRGLQVCSRAELLGWFSRRRPTVAVAGTHGKTTTASMVVAVARAAGVDPGVVVGGWRGGESQAATGGDRLLIVEADEYDRSFLALQPWGAVVTNIDADHHDTYQDAAALDAAFGSFLGRRCDWVVVGPDSRARAVAAAAGGTVMRCGTTAADDVQLVDAVFAGTGCQLQVRLGGQERPGLHLRVSGRHNVDNALTVIGVAACMHWPWQAVTEGLQAFTGVDRRLQCRGMFEGVLVVDDYAHHPTEVRAAIDWARLHRRQVIALFQPHLYSRTRLLAAAFADELGRADRVFLCDIYAAREAPSSGISGRMLAQEVRRRCPRVHYEASPAAALREALQACGEGDLLLVMGAGDIGDHLDRLLAGQPQERVC